MNRTYFLTALSASLIVPALAHAAQTDLRQDTIIPVVFEQTLTVRGSHDGDRFSARVDDFRYVPSGSRFEGRVVRVIRSVDNQPGSMELEFTDLILPDGTRTPVDAVPIPLTDRYVTRDRDGRFTPKNDSRKKGAQVLGGMLGGLIVGSIMDKQMEGVILGGVAGIILAETDKSNDNNTVVSKGNRLGALIRRDVQFQYQDRGGWNDRDGWGGTDRGRYSDRDPNRRTDDMWRRDENIRRGNEGPTGREPVVILRGRPLQWGADQPYREGSTIMVPLERAAEELELRVIKETEGSSAEVRPSESIFVEGPEGYLEIERGSRRARLDGRPIELAQDVVERNGVVYVPLECLSRLTKDELFSNGQALPRRRG